MLETLQKAKLITVINENSHICMAAITLPDSPVFPVDAFDRRTKFELYAQLLAAFAAIENSKPLANQLLLAK